MDNQKNLILAMVLCLGLLWGYTKFLMPEQPPLPAPTAAKTAQNAPPTTAPPAQVVSPGPAISSGPVASPGASPAPQAAKDVVVDTPQAQYTFSTLGGSLRKVQLKKYFQEPGHTGGQYVLLDLKAADLYSLGLNLPNFDPQLSLGIFTPSTTALKVEAGQAPATLTFSAQRGPLSVKKTLTFKPDSYAFDLAVNLVNQGQAPLEFTPEVFLSEHAEKANVNTYAFTGIEAHKNGSFVEHSQSDLEKPKTETGFIPWVAMNIPYFMGAVVPSDDANQPLKRTLRGLNKGGLMTATLVEPTKTLAPGETYQQAYMVFYGPRDLEILEPLGHGLAAAVDFGWFDLIAKPMLALVNWLYGSVGNYGVVIIIITLLIKILLWPIAAKSYKSMKAMQQLQPMVAKLREKYGDDKAKLNQETMALYKTYKVNPLGGCLPMVVQIPVFIAFYKVLGASIELRHSPFFLWINDLAMPDRLPLGFDFVIPYVQTGPGLPVLTLLMGASMFIQQKMTPTTGDPTQAKMMLMMPVVFTFMFINFPSGLVLYWLVQNVLGIGQQYWTQYRKTPEPKAAGS